MGCTSFEHEKRQCLEKDDKSRIGSVDKGIKKVVDLINKHRDFYTTSSCSGRTLIINVPKRGKKWDSKWMFTSHDRISLAQLRPCLKKLPKDAVWLKKEGLILHVCCRTIAAASAIVDASQRSGLKRTGMISAKRKIMVEICDTEKIEAPIAAGGKLIVDDSYLKLLVKEANAKQDRTRKKINRLYLVLKESLNRNFN